MVRRRPASSWRSRQKQELPRDRGSMDALVQGKFRAQSSARSRRSVNGNCCDGMVGAWRRKLRDHRGAASPVPAEGPWAACRHWWLPRGNLRGPGWGRRQFSLTPPFAHRARMPVPTPAPPRTPWAAPAAGCTSPSWRCPSSPPCLGTAACAPGTGCGFAVRPGAALRPALAGPSTTGQSQVWASCGLADSMGPWEAAEGQQGSPRWQGGRGCESVRWVLGLQTWPWAGRLGQTHVWP